MSFPTLDPSTSFQQGLGKACVCCEYTNIFPFFSPLFKVSITFLISFRLPLFRLYYLETTDIFPTFFPSNTLLI